MSTGKIRFDSMREVSSWARRTGGAALGSIWTGLEFPKPEPPTPKPLSSADRRILNRKTLPTPDMELVARKTDRCEEEKGCWATFKCAEYADQTDGHAYRRAYILGCKSPNCALCRRAYATKRAREAWGRPAADPEANTGALRFLSAENKVGWWYIVCTLPRHLRPFVTQDRIKALRDSFWRQFHSFALNRQGLDGQDLHLGALEVMHPVGDKDNGEGEKVFHPHLNFIIPAIAFGTYNAPDGLTYAYKRLRLWMLTRELAEIRAIWKRTLVAVFGQEIPTDVVVNLNYRGTVHGEKTLERALREQKHCLKYNFRSFPGWPSWTRRITRYGYLASRKIGEFRSTWEEWEAAPYSEPAECEGCGGSIEIETDDPLAEVYSQNAKGTQLLEEVRDLWSFHPGSLPDPGGGSSEGEYVPDLHASRV